MGATPGGFSLRFGMERRKAPAAGVGGTGLGEGADAQGPGGFPQPLGRASVCLQRTLK